MNMPCAVDMDLQRHMRALDAEDSDERAIEERVMDLQSDHQFVLGMLEDCILADTLTDESLLAMLPLSLRRIAMIRALTGDDALAVILTTPAGSDAHDAALVLLRGLVEARAKKSAKNYVSAVGDC
jgi:hypothetical protein